MRVNGDAAGAGVDVSSVVIHLNEGFRIYYNLLKNGIKCHI